MCSASFIDARSLRSAVTLFGAVSAVHFNLNPAVHPNVRAASRAFATAASAAALRPHLQPAARRPCEDERLDGPEQQLRRHLPARGDGPRLEARQRGREEGEAPREELLLPQGAVGALGVDEMERVHVPNGRRVGLSPALKPHELQATMPALGRKKRKEKKNQGQEEKRRERKKGEKRREEKMKPFAKVVKESGEERPPP